MGRKVEIVIQGRLISIGLDDLKRQYELLSDLWTKGLLNFDRLSDAQQDDLQAVNCLIGHMTGDEFNPTSDNEKYTLGAGHNCPVCGSDNIEGIGGGFDIDGDVASNKMGCTDCNASWSDIYTFAGFDNLSR